MLGLKRKTIKLVPHQKSWITFFQKEKEKLLKVIPDIYVEHVGSTAIPNIVAKPIIDIVVGIDKIKNYHLYITKLKKLGFEYHNNRGSKFNKFFTKGPEDCRTTYVHLVKYKGNIWNKYINFRDVLNRNIKLAKKYEKLKLDLATKFTNRDKYTKAKAVFIGQVNK
ncbi:MAG TPA: GrpB family protein [Patescibacteria group bacterium]|nr:GrpB family protein [Patescibacteria group bacterium]